LVVEAGQEYSLNLPIVAAPIAMPSPWSPAARANRRQSGDNTNRTERNPNEGRSIVPVIVGGAAFVAGMTTGIVFRLDSDAQFSTADSLRARLTPTGCRGAAAFLVDCAALKSASITGDRSRNWSTAGLLVAAASLIGTLTYWYWPEASATTRAQTFTRWELTGDVRREFSGVSIKGDF
jgi:hypothetical protein